MDATAATTYLELAGAALSDTTSGALLDEIAWPREVEERFFADGERELPVVEYAPAAHTHDDEIARLVAVREKLEGDHPILVSLRGAVSSAIDKARLLSSVGTSELGRVSNEIYGGARTTFLGKTKLELAEHLLARITSHGWDRRRPEAEPDIGAEDLRDRFESRVAGKKNLELRVVIDPKLTSKAIAGATRVRIREGATFHPWEVEGLYRHEIETHAFSAQNGAAQRAMPFLKSGGPRTTETQEGLAVFAELYHRALATPRLRRLALRVKTCAMAEDGATFLDVYRALVDGEGAAPRDAFLDAQRLFRGGDVRGGSVFTKDTVYISGLLRTYAFLATFVRGGFRDECELVMAGRIDLDDITALVALDRLGLVTRPKLLPRWLRDWETLLPYFSFTSFLDGLDLGPVEAGYRHVIDTAKAAVPKPVNGRKQD